MSETTRVTITYQTVTPESAEHGDFADHGFVGDGGWRYSIADEEFQARVAKDGHVKALADMTPSDREFYTIEEVVEFCRIDGPFEASCSSPCENGHCWVTQSSPSHDRDYFEKGEETRRSYHFDCNDPATHRAIIEALTE